MNNTLEIIRGCMIAAGSITFIVSGFSFWLFRYDPYQDDYAEESEIAVNIAILFNVVSGIGTLWMILFWRV